ARDRVDDERLAALGEDPDCTRTRAEGEPADLLERVGVEEVRGRPDEIDADDELPRRIDSDRARPRLRVDRRNRLERVEIEHAHRRAERVADVKPAELGDVREAGGVAAYGNSRLDLERRRVDDRHLVGVRVRREDTSRLLIEAD